MIARPMRSKIVIPLVLEERYKANIPDEISKLSLPLAATGSIQNRTRNILQDIAAGQRESCLERQPEKRFRPTTA